MSGDSDDRAEKLAGRWGESETEVAESDDEIETSADDAEEGASGRVADESVSAEPMAETSDDADELTTREMQSQMLYLDPELYRELDLTFEELKLRYRRERDDKLQKNKDFYAGLLRLGLAQLGDVRERGLEELEDDLDL